MLARRVALSFFLAAVVTVARASFCNKTQPPDAQISRVVSRDRKVLNVTLHWATDPARAASALFATVLRDALGFQNVVLRESKYTDLKTFAEKVPHVKTRRYTEVILALGIAWKPGENPPWEPNNGSACGLAGPRLKEIGASSIPLRQQLHVYIAEEYRNQSQCLSVTQWTFYTDVAALAKCGFTNATFSNSTKNAMIIELGADNAMKISLTKFAEELNFEIKNVNRTSLFRMSRTSNHSFLFMDYDIWSGHEYVRAIPEPFCLRSECLLEQGTEVSMRVGDVDLLEEVSPELIHIVYNFPNNFISGKTIRDILELESQTESIEDAAKKWISKDNYALNWAREEYKASFKKYDLLFFYCGDDPYYESYTKLITDIYIPDIKDRYNSQFQIVPWKYRFHCRDVTYLRNSISEYLSKTYKQRLMGAVVAGTMNITDVAALAGELDVPLMFYDAAELNTLLDKKDGSTWLSTGNTRHLALALRDFVLDHNWSRIAVLSEPTEKGKRFLSDLKSVSEPKIAFRDRHVSLKLSESQAKTTLQEIKNGPENAHIILINTNYEDAVTILAVGESLGMTSTEEYVWILREWQPNNKTVKMTHFTFSFWCRCGSDVSNSSGLSNVREEIDIIFPNCTWPPHASSLGDALYTLTNSFYNAILECPQMRNDLRNKAAIQLFRYKIMHTPIQGITQDLKYKGHSLEEAVVFVDVWHGAHHSHLARWRVNAKTNEVKVEESQGDAYPLKSRPADGASRCLVTSGDPYLPTCHDWEWAMALIFVLLSPPTLIFVYRILRRRLKEHEKMLIYKVISQRQKHAAVLSAGYLVDRSALSLRRELGAGRFGYVRLAWLRLPGKTPQYVAAKSLRNNQDESEILHEACVLASLNHENIIRLLGVCIDKDPPLILMEVAFFGDLLQYLRDRRYLVEETNSEIMHNRVEEEASHVSAEALTRLARQAASALGYLAVRGVIHRDLRASNCLVDANRTLKLADFGLARETKAIGSEIGAEYACRRRGLFPVLWMAPESLIYGIFSPASDMWSFGVLVFELVTLGARPFGDMSPLRVMQHVTTGGKPTMPRDATPHTTALTRLCWQREPEQRPTAAHVMAYLTDRPNALRPAFDGDNEQPTDIDSGCGESPISEFLPC